MNLRAAGPLVAASAVAFTAFGMAPVRGVHACSGGPDWNPVAESEVILSGVIQGWEETTIEGFPEGAHVKPIRVDLAVEERLKGEAPSRFSFVDTGSLTNVPAGQEPMWSGSSGACGAFNADPTGMYVFMGFSRDETGTRRSNLLTTFYIGDRAGFEAFRGGDMAEFLLGTYGLERPPATGHGASRDDGATDYTLLMFAALLIAFGAGGLKLLRSTE